MNINELDLNKLVLLLRRNILVILFITFLFASAVAIYAYFLKPIFSSSVTISVVNDQSSKLAAVLPGELSKFNDETDNLATIRLTLQSKKFIGTVLDKIDISQQYFIEKRFKKIEREAFPNLEMQVSSLHDSLYETYIEVTPITQESYILTIEKLGYHKEHRFGDKVEDDYFKLSIIRSGQLKETSYLFKNRNKRMQINSILANLKVQTLSDNVLKIVYEDTLPKRSQLVVEEIAKSFIEYALEKKTGELKKTLEFLDEQILLVKEDLSLEAKKLRSYQEETSLYVSTDASTSIYEDITVKNDEIKQLKVQLQALRTFRKSLKQDKLNTVVLINSGIDTSSIQSMIEAYRVAESEINEMKFQQVDISKQMTQSEKLNSLIESLEENKELLKELRFNFTYEHPEVLLTEKKVSELIVTIEAYIQNYLQKSFLTKTQLKDKIFNNILLVEKSVKSKIESLSNDLVEKNDLLKSLPEKDLTMQDLKRKFTLSENVYTFLLQKKMEIEMKKASTIANTQIIEDAVLPLFPIKPNKKMIVAVGLLLGLILGIAYIFLRVILDTKIRDASTIESLTDTPLYGTLPTLDNQRFFKEALRNVRTNLQFVLPQDKKCRVILISSTVAGEGKTTVIAGLASVIAQTNKKVLLMDLDLRKPRLYKEIKKSNKVGMSNYLTEEIPLENVIQSVEENLDFFPAGSVPPNPSELLMSHKFEQSIEKLMEDYDYILFDSAPIGTVTDANMLLKYTDLLLLILKANYAEKVYLKNFNKMKEEKNIHSAGLILNQVKLQKSGYGYGYGYAYDYGYGMENKKES